MKKLIVITLLMLSQSAFAEWTYVAQNNYAKYYVDLTTREFKEDLVKVWEYTDYRRAINKTDSSVKVYMEYDCKNNLSRGFDYAFYSGQDLAGDITHTFLPDDEMWDAIAPDTVGAELIKEVCNKNNVETD